MVELGFFLRCKNLSTAASVRLHPMAFMSAATLFFHLFWRK